MRHFAKFGADLYRTNRFSPNFAHPRPGIAIKIGSEVFKRLGCEIWPLPFPRIRVIFSVGH